MNLPHHVISINANYSNLICCKRSPFDAFMAVDTILVVLSIFHNYYMPDKLKNLNSSWNLGGSTIPKEIMKNFQASI